MKHPLILSLLLLSSTCPAFSAHARQVAAGDGCSKWDLEQFYLVYENHPISDSLKSGLLNTTVVFSHDTLIINGRYKAKFVQEKAKTNDYFDDDLTLRDFYVNLLKEKGIDISDSISYIRFTAYSDYSPDEFSFDSYSLWQTLICTDNYLCVPYESDGMLLYKNKEQPSNHPQLPYNTKLDPAKAKYEYLSESEIVPSDNPENSCYVEDGKIRYIPMPMKGEYTVILVPHDGGDYPYRYVLHTLKGNKEIDALYVEGEWWEPDSDDVQKTSFTIDTDYTITISTVSANGRSVEVYRINEKGEFVVWKK